MADKKHATGSSGFDNIFKDFSVSLRESIRNIIKQEGYVRFTIKNKSVPQIGNFLSILYEVDITGETAEGKKVTSLFIKKAITLDKIRVANVSDAYSREHFIYNQLSEIFSKLQVAANVPNEERFRFLKSYECNNEAIIMENLCKKGFKTYDGRQVVTIKYAELSTIELAKFHALSYVFKKRAPKYFDDKIKTIKHPFNLDSDWEGFIDNVCAVAAQVVEGEARAKVRSYTPRMLQTFQEFMKDSVQTNGCLCHGDYKVLNILAREVDGKVAEVQPIDYQLAHYGNPVVDFLFFIFTGTDREFRRQHLSYLKNLYFGNFAKFLTYFNIDANSIYSRQEFERDYDERLELGLVIGLYLTAFTFAHVDEGFDLSRRSLTELVIVPDEMFAERIRGIVEEYIELGLL